MEKILFVALGGAAGAVCRYLLGLINIRIDFPVITLAINLIGAVPDDENIVISTNQGEPLVGNDTLPGQAYMNICKRVMGEEVPMLDLDAGGGLWSKIVRIFSKK